VPGPAPLLLVYDAECPACRRAVDWIQRRDTQGLITPFPYQNPELVRIAPELAGRPLETALHGLDTRTRAVTAGGALLPLIALRLPRWRVVAPLLLLPGISHLCAWIYRSRAARRCRPGATGR